MSPPKLPAEAKMAFVVLVVLAFIASVLDVGAIGWVVAPICILLGWFAILRAPLRNTMLVLMFFALVLENPSEGPGGGQWLSPWAPIGALMLAHFKFTIGFGPIGGMDLMLMAAIAAFYLQRRTLSRGIPTPRPMIKLAHLTFATIVFTLLIGKMRGGQMQWAVWQMDRVTYLPTVFLLCQAAFSNPKDYLAVGKVALAASLIRATQAMWVRAVVDSTVNPETGENSLPYATTHNDSMLFAVGSVILVALLLQRAGPKASRLAFIGLPILVGGMLANNRRMVWVEIILVFFTVYMITETNSFKRKLNRVLIGSLPLIIGYIAAGWSSGSGIFKPVKVIRSAVDSSADTSTAWRDLENFNLVFTMRNFPLTGVGYGNGFWEMWPMPAVDYSLERYVPHDSILGLYCYGGWVGFFGITSLWVGGVYFAIRAYHSCKEPVAKAAALASFGAILVYYLQCFGDMGLGSWTGVFLVGPALAIASKLTVAAGAWETQATARVNAAGFSVSSN
ncbi:MAG TPA: hypothetical protein VEQ59_04575 [Polyangiaceae bacterium]|nr:hypothetical protein [Polyangiaceae bacterium]